MYRWRGRGAEAIRAIPAMRRLHALLACVAWSGATAATPSSMPGPRDGTWLQNGVKQNAVTVTSYVCAVTDLEKYLVQRATTLEQALHDGKRKKKHLDPRMLSGMMRALPLVIPLVDTDFLKDDPSCDKAVVIVRDYLDKYPEMLPKDADVIIERALLDAYSKPPEQP